MSISTQTWTKLKMLLAEADKWVGVSEKGGDNKGPEVEMFQKAVDGKAQGEPWCLAFVQYCVKKVDARFEAENGGPNPPDVLAQTEHVKTLWINTPKEARLADPISGCLVIWEHWDAKGPTGRGHVGIVDQINDKTMTTFEGNTGPGTEVEREGDGVYKKTRSRKPIGSMRIVGFLVPWL